MLIAVLSAALFAQASPAELTEPPRLRQPLTPQCACADEPQTDYVTLEGLVVDAEVTLAASGRAVNARQATIFEVARASEQDVRGRTRLWHTTIIEQCGVTFEYGRRYTVAARRTEAGDLETDECLMRALAPSEAPGEASGEE